MKRTSQNIKDLNEQLKQNNLLIEFSKKDHVELLQDESQKNHKKIIVINKQPSFFYYTLTSQINPPNQQITTQKELLIPTLKLLQTHPTLLKTITIDMNAIKFIINGADIMRPGITNIDDNIQPSQPVLIIDQTHKKPVAIGISLHSSDELHTITTGKVIKNIHFVGDELWKFEIK